MSPPDATIITVAAGATMPAATSAATARTVVRSPRGTERATVRVCDLMSQPVLTVSVDETLWDAWQLLFVSGLRHLVVVDDTICIGIISDRSVLSDLPLTPEHLSRRRIGDILARSPVEIVRPHDSVAWAARVMTARAAEAVPVLDDDERLVGIITGSDLVRHLADAVD